MKPTSEQDHIMSLATSTSQNVMMNALAGTGKSTTLRLIERQMKVAPILYLAFNKRNVDIIKYNPKADKDEAEKRMKSTTVVKTFNSLGHGIWAKTQGSDLSLAKAKSADILRGIIDETPKRDQGPIWDSFWQVVQGVALAKALGYVPEGKYPNARRLISMGDFHRALDESPDDLTSDLIDAVLIRSIKASYSGSIDFNDQIYMPALFGGIYPQFPLVAVDEYQDLNPTNHAMLDKLVKHRLFGVGDPWQNIYGFRGAKSQGMAEAQEKFKMEPCDLSTSFRCPKEIVLNARWRVPHFKYIKEGGYVEVLKTLLPVDIPDGAAIICRNNAPLFRTALHLLASRRSVCVAGSDIGPKLIATLKRLGPDDMTQDSLLSAIDDWLAEKLAKESKTAQDTAECMKVFATFGATLSQAVSYAEHLFAQQGAIQLLTGHKAKGLEFPIVYHLDPWIIGVGEQELNLRYVIQTRSEDRYYEINSLDIRWN